MQTCMRVFRLVLKYKYTVNSLVKYILWLAYSAELNNNLQYCYHLIVGIIYHRCFPFSFIVWVVLHGTHPGPTTRSSLALWITDLRGFPLPIHFFIPIGGKNKIRFENRLVWTLAVSLKSGSIWHFPVTTSEFWPAHSTLPKCINTVLLMSANPLVFFKRHLSYLTHPHLQTARNTSKMLGEPFETIVSWLHIINLIVLWFNTFFQMHPSYFTSVYVFSEKR